MEEAATLYPQVMTAPSVPFLRLRLLSVCVCVSAAVALPPEKTGSCCAEEKTHDRDSSQSPAGPQKQLQFEVSVDRQLDV